ncbi:MAG: polyprenyl synthetase family protein, partial [Firmicutes bacterium]|nr:polyprenyl synthetase family protein [Bacillota bacterium]
LAGDGLLSTAFEIMNKDMLLSFDNESMLKRKVKAVYELSKYSGCRGMVAGQVADIEAENKQCSKELLDYIHINKTAAIIIGSVRAGAHLGGADNEMLEALTSYAENLGLAFQIADDIRDVIGDEKQLGKKTGMDAENNKSTYPALYGLEASRERLNYLTEKAISVISKYGEKSEFFVDLVKQLAVRIS